MSAGLPPKLIADIVAVAVVALLIGSVEAIALKVALRQLGEVEAQHPAITRQDQQRELATFRRRARYALFVAIPVAVCAAPAALDVAIALSNESMLVRWLSAATVELLALAWFSGTMGMVYWIGRERILRRSLLE
jgi:hypothetical protein